MQGVLPADPERYLPRTNPTWWGVPGVANTPAAATFAARAGQRHAAYKILWSYDGDPTGGMINIYSGGTLIAGPFYVTAGGVGFIPILVVGRMGQNLNIHLAAGGAGVTGSIGVEKYFPHVG